MHINVKNSKYVFMYNKLFRESDMAADVLLEIVYLKDCSFNIGILKSNFTYIQFYVKLLNNKFD